MLLEEGVGGSVGGKSEKCLYMRCNYAVSGYRKLSHFHIFGLREAFGEWILGEMWLENFNQGGKVSAGGHLHFQNVFDSSPAKRSQLLFFQISVDSRDNYILLRIKGSLYVSALLQPFLPILSPSEAHSR